MTDAQLRALEMLSLESDLLNAVSLNETIIEQFVSQESKKIITFHAC